MLTPPQKSLYWRTWSAICAEQGWSHESAPRKDQRRYALHHAAGCPQSMTQFSNRHLDAFLRAARPLMAATAPKRPTADASERKRLIWRIQQDSAAAGLDEAYIRRLATDLTGLGCYEELALDDLTNLRNLIHNRTATRRQAPRKYTLRPEKTYAQDPF